MTTEEKAKAYDEALERARKAYNAIKPEHYGARKIIENAFPELRESEDERIRKELLDFVRSFWADHKEKLPQTSRWIIYLEKQKEQNHDIEPIQRSWYMEGYRDREFGKEPKWIVKTGECGPRYEENPKYGEMLAEQKPAWSEEDERAFSRLLLRQDLTHDEILFLAHLRPSWKPSEEQMKELKEASAIMKCDSDDNAFPSLKTLYEQLKKL